MILLVEEHARPGVAKMTSVEISTIFELEKLYNEALSRLSSFLRVNNPSLVTDIGSWDWFNPGLSGRWDSKHLTEACHEFLARIGLQTQGTHTTPGTVWRTVAQMLDMAIVDYSGAYIEDFSTRLGGRTQSSFHIPHRIFYPDDDLNILHRFPPHPLIKVRRCRMMNCVDGFLGGLPVWVFNDRASSFSNRPRLYLSTTIADLGNVWGPSWKIVRDSRPGEIQNIDIGNGTIVPWSLDSSAVQCRENEAFAHWISYKSWDSNEVQRGQNGIERDCFLESDVLLIGADTKAEGLVVNASCKPTVQPRRQIKDKLRERNALRELGTDRARRYTDSHAIQVTGSVMGFFNVVDTITYKRGAGQSMKVVSNPPCIPSYFSGFMNLLLKKLDNWKYSPKRFRRMGNSIF